MENLALIILTPFIISSPYIFFFPHELQPLTQSKIKKYWVALDQVRITKSQGWIRISNFVSHRGKRNNIFISLSHTVGCQTVLLFRIFSERIECRGNDTSVGDVPQWRRNKNWLQVYVRESLNCMCGCAKTRRRREVFSLPSSILCKWSKDSGPAVVSKIPLAGETRKVEIPRRDTKQCFHLHMCQSLKIFSKN